MDTQPKRWAGDWPPPADYCLWCRERFVPGDQLGEYPVGTPAGPRRQHWACGLRAIIGGVNHQAGLCSCCGGTLPPDPEGMTDREAAEAAAKCWLAMHPGREPNAVEYEG